MAIVSLVALLVVLGIPILLLILWVRSRRQSAALEQARLRLDDLDRKVLELASGLAALEPREVAAAEPFVEAPLAAAPPTPTVPMPMRVAVPPHAAPKPLAPETPPPPAPVERALPTVPPRRWLEQRFLANWTGILGSVVLVAGVTFMAIWTALRLAPFSRFLMTMAVAAILIGGSYVLTRAQRWGALGAWLRSAGAAILQFACAASGGMPGLGLQWIHDPIPALVLLLFGIVVNLGIAFASRGLLFAALHVVLSLIPLTIVPASSLTLAIASSVALFGVLIRGRDRPETHLAVVVGAYLAFHLVWASRMGEGLDATAPQLIAAALCAVVFGATVLAAHHEEGVAKSSASPLQVAIHLSAWVLLALAMFQYVVDLHLRGVALLVLGLCAYGLGLRARAPWLRRAEVLSAHALVLLAILCGWGLGIGPAWLATIVLAETLAFRLLVPRGRDLVVDVVSDVSPVLASVALALGVASDRGIESGVLAFVGVLLAGIGQRVLRTPILPEGARVLWTTTDRLALPGVALGWLAGGLGAVGLVALQASRWMEAAALGIGVGLLIANRRTRTLGLGGGALIALVGAHLLAWQDVLASRGQPALLLASQLGPMVGLAAAAVLLARGNLLGRVAIVVLGIDVGLGSLVYFEPISSLIPGVLWLMLSLVALELANRLPRGEAETVLALAYAYLVAFAAAYSLVAVQSWAYLGPLRIRVLIELLGMAGFAYWWAFRPAPTLAGSRAWLWLHPYFVEWLLVGAAVCVIVEIPSVWWAMVWGAIALALIVRPAESLLDARVRFYSVVFYWASVADMAAVLSVREVPATQWYEQPELTSLLVIGLQIAYAAAMHERRALDTLEAPSQLAWVAALARKVSARRNLYVYYPLFAGIALFLYERFDRSLLTLLWAAEAFGVFVMSVWLRESQFRAVALVGLGACLARLVVVDMAEANLGLRGAVFIGVGLLMLAMNAIYNRYRARFQS